MLKKSLVISSILPIFLCADLKIEEYSLKNIENNSYIVMDESEFKKFKKNVEDEEKAKKLALKNSKPLNTKQILVKNETKPKKLTQKNKKVKKISKYVNAVKARIYLESKINFFINNHKKISKNDFYVIRKDINSMILKDNRLDIEMINENYNLKVLTKNEYFNFLKELKKSLKESI